MGADRRCSKCGHLIGKGVRFNAEKKAIGAYFSTKIWAFTMRAPCCQNRIEIHTDPKNARYIIVEGAREKVMYPCRVPPQAASTLSRVALT